MSCAIGCPVEPYYQDTLVATDRVFYVNSGIGTSGDGTTPNKAWKTLAEYTTYAAAQSLTDGITLIITDNAYYGDINMYTLAGNTEKLTLYAPAATFKDVDFRKGTNANYKEDSKVYAGYITGNIYMSKNTTLFAREVGTIGHPSAPDPSTVINTDQSTDVSANLGNIVIHIQNFDGTFNWGGSFQYTMFVYIDTWGVNNTQLNTSLATLTTGNDTIAKLRGVVKGYSLPLKIPLVERLYPLNNSAFMPFVFRDRRSLLTATYGFTLFVKNIENWDTSQFTSVKLQRHAQGGIGTGDASVTLTPANVEVADNIVSFNITLSETDRTTLISNTIDMCPLVVTIPMRLRMDDGYKSGQDKDILVAIIYSQRRP